MDLNQELDRRSKLGVRNIKISPLFEKDKVYDLKTEKEIDYESRGGNLMPEYNHCWLTWESKWLDKSESETGYERWSKEAYNFRTIAEAEEAKKYLEKKLA